MLFYIKLTRKIIPPKLLSYAPKENVMSPNANMERASTVKRLTSFFMHKHYCENDVDALISYFSEDLAWIGAAEHEYALGRETVSHIFRQFSEKGPPCLVYEEKYDAVQLSIDIFLCTGMLYIATAPESDISLRVHQRVTTIFRWESGSPKCCHIHISNPYSEMMDSDVGFPEKMMKESREYLLETVKEQTKILEKQKSTLEEQNRLLERLSFEDTLTGLYNRTKFNLLSDELAGGSLGLAIFDINGLKLVNDKHGHQAGDSLIRRAADWIKRQFPGTSFRRGGDEFFVIDRERDEKTFLDAVQCVRSAAEKHDVNIAIGVFWKEEMDLDAQIHEADKLMYEDKKRHYSFCQYDRRKH